MSRLMEDRCLLAGFRRGEPKALEVVYREYRSPLLAMLARGFAAVVGRGRVMVHGIATRDTREDVTQEVFLRAFDASARRAYDGRRPYRSYLFTVARNLVIDSLRRERTVVSLTWPDVTCARDCAADDQVAGAQLARDAQKLIELLDPLERALFDARLVHQLCVEETALRLGVSEHFVKSRESALKKRFFVALKARGYFDGHELGHLGLRATRLIPRPSLARQATPEKSPPSEFRHPY